MTTSPPLLNMTRAAKALGVSRKTIYNWIKSGDLQATRMNGRNYIAGAEVERVLRARGDR